MDSHQPILIISIFVLFQVRFATIQVVEAMVQKMGEDYMMLVPETIPFLAELMEGERFSALLSIYF